MITEKTFVYLIRAGETNNYKIGISSRVEYRFSTLQTGHYEKLSIVESVCFDSRSIALLIESELHTTYKKFRVINEWFRLNKHQIKEIKYQLSLGVTETIVLKARIAELEKQLDNSVPIEALKVDKARDLDKVDIVTSLWTKADGSIAKNNKKLTPKSQVINIKRRREAEQLSKVYKELLELGYIELRGNKGYFALVDLDIALIAVGATNVK